MEKLEVKRPGARFLLTAASLVVVIAGLKAAESILVPIMFAAFLAVISAPAMYWLKERKVPQVLAVTLVVLGVVAFLVGVGTLMGSSVTDFSNSIPEYRERLTDILAQLVEFARSRGVEVDKKTISESVDPSQAMGLMSSALTSVAETLSDMLFVILTMIFILLEAAAIPGKIRAALDDPNASMSRYAKIAKEINRYLVIKTLVSLGTGVFAGVWVWILGVDFPFLWGLVAFLLNFIPNIGSLIAAAPPVLLALIQFGGWRALLVGAGYMVVNTVMGNVIEPHFMGRKLGLSSLVVFLSLVVWGWLWGPIGMLLSVPLTMMVKILLENNEDFRWVAIFLGPDAPEFDEERPRTPSASLKAVLKGRRESEVWGEEVTDPATSLTDAPEVAELIPSDSPREAGPDSLELDAPPRDESGEDPDA